MRLLDRRAAVSYATSGLRRLLLLLPLSGLACQHGKTPRDCAGKTREQCLWERAQRKAVERPLDGGNGSSVGPEFDPRVEPAWTRMEDILGQAAEWLSDGLGGDVVSAQAREWCAEKPAVTQTDHGPSWVCHLEDAPKIHGQDFNLEGGAGGVLAVAARDFTGEQSERVVRQALGRWSSWCESARFDPIERYQDEEFHSCALPGGPLLVVGRFPQDLEADLWQVSLTVMGAG